jgi:hypothetical protein
MYHDDDANHAESEAPEMTDDAVAGGPPQDEATLDDEMAQPARPDLKASFLGEIARAMRATATQERDRIATSVTERTVAHEQKIRDRGATEATELRRLADVDVEQIQRTADEEVARIKADAERQIDERRGTLANHLDRHAALVETEIGRVRGAVDDYNAELDGFFGRLAEEQSPAEIARLAGQLPEPPDLDEVGATARADAINQIVDEEAGQAAADAAAAESAAPAPEPAVVGVMAADAGTPVFDDSGEPAEAEPVPAGGMADDAAEATSEEDGAARSGGSVAGLLRNLTPWANSDRSPDDDAG